ncbi:hypothetical protein ACH5RR_035372 [Cinchona calisaya]|uniref:Proton pump-interactor 1 n=1 Tax=Cinchona calisaya TaxID=153742 RepID=A0ABD2YEY8_9GENT
MTAEIQPDLPLELPELSNNSTTNSKVPSLHIETLHNSPHFPNFPPPHDANGINHHSDEISEDVDADDNSYVFVTHNVDSPLPLDKDQDQDQDHHVNGSAPLDSDLLHHPLDIQNGKLVPHTTSANATQIASSIDGFSILHQEDIMDKCDGDVFPVGCTAASEAIQLNRGGGAVTDADPHQLDSDSSPVLTENRESEVAVSILELHVDLVETPKPEITSLDATKSTDVCRKSHEDGLDSIGQFQDIQQFLHSSLEATPSKSPGSEVSKPNFTAQQHSHSFDEVGDAQESENAHSDATQYEPPLIEVQKVNLEEQCGRDSATLTEERVECGMPPMISEESESSEFDKIGQRDEEETLLSEATENQEIIIRLGSNLVQGIEAENSVNVVDVLSATATAFVPVLNENIDHFPVSSLNGYVPDLKESNDYADDCETHINESNEYADDNCETLLELHKSSADADAWAPATSCLEREIDIVDNPVESLEIVQDSAKEHEFQHGASPLEENIIANNDEVCEPETEVVGNIAVQSIEEVPDIFGEQEIEHATCPPRQSAVVDTDEVIKSEAEVVSSVSGNLEGANFSPVIDTRSEIIRSNGVIDNGFVVGENMQSCFASTTISGTEFELGTANSKDKTSTFKVDDMNYKTEAATLDLERADTYSMSSAAEVKFEVENSSGIGGRDVPCSNTVASQTEVSDGSVVVCESVPSVVPDIKDVQDQGDQLSVLVVKSSDKLLCQGINNVEQSDINEISASLPENSSTDASAAQDVGFGPLTRPFHFLIRMPRFDDLKIREQIRHAHLQVEDKTKHRDAFRLEIQKHKANRHGHAAEYEAAMSQARASKRLVKSKRTEIDSLQAVINKVKNAIYVEEIDARIYNMEYMIQHETLPLKEEKQFIREIKQLKQLREQLSSNIGSQDEVQQALIERDKNEVLLKILKKELDNLKDGVLKAEVIARAAQKKYDDENIKLKELISQFEAANDIRQAAYHHFQSLKRDLFEKKKQFLTYKDNAAAANQYAATKDRGALHQLCVGQVETVMDLWNKTEEFRKEYVHCNMRSTLRRLGTLDGRSLGPDEEPPVLASYVVGRLVSNRANTSPMLPTQILKQESPLELIEDVTTDDSAMVKDVEAKSQTTNSREPVKPTLGIGLATISGRGISDNEISEKEHMPVKEELELERKADELRKAEAAAKMREQLRLEEKAKALEAVDRKKRIAEKAQMRAELRAQKEAELKEKEREKRLRKKERRKAGGAEVPDGNNIGESIPSSESLALTVKELEIKENPPAATIKRPQNKSSLFMKQSKTKSIPPPLRNRGKRKIQQWMWVIISCIVVIVLFLLGNIGFFSNLSNLRQRSYGF